MSKFFKSGGSLNELRNSAAKKRKLPQKSQPVKKFKEKNEKKKKEEEEDEIEEDGDVFDIDSEDNSSSDSEGEEEEETAAEKRLRLAKQFLSTIKEDDETLTEDQIAQKLDDEAREISGRLCRNLATKLKKALEDEPLTVSRVMRGHKLSPTCVTVTEDGTYAFSGSKDCGIIQWDIETGAKFKYPGGRHYDTKKGSTGKVLAIDISSDGKYLASGGEDDFVRIWDPRTRSLIHSFSGHKGSVLAMAFRKGTNQLFSGAGDQTVKIWSLDQMMYVETLYGHQAEVLGVDSLNAERAVTCGDTSCHLWKVVEQSQLIFRGHNSSIDSISLINEENFVTGSQDGSVGLWSIKKKRPACIYAKAHGKDAPWITSVASMKFSDIFVSGSSDGNLNFWNANIASQKITRVSNLEMHGFINGICFPKSGRFLVAAVGQEHRLGRWWRNPDVRNSIQIVPLPALD